MTYIPAKSENEGVLFTYQELTIKEDHSWFGGSAIPQITDLHGDYFGFRSDYLIYWRRRCLEEMAKGMVRS
jgi:hypothetical protein